jgi:hypothetical protein
MRADSENGFPPGRYDHRPAYMTVRLSLGKYTRTTNGEDIAQIVRNAVIRAGDQNCFCIILQPNEFQLVLLVVPY